MEQLEMTPAQQLSVGLDYYAQAQNKIDKRKRDVRLFSILPALGIGTKITFPYFSSKISNFLMKNSLSVPRIIFGNRPTFIRLSAISCGVAASLLGWAASMATLRWFNFEWLITYLPTWTLYKEQAVIETSLKSKLDSGLINLNAISAAKDAIAVQRDHNFFNNKRITQLLERLSFHRWSSNPNR